MTKNQIRVSKLKCHESEAYLIIFGSCFPFFKGIFNMLDYHGHRKCMAITTTQFSAIVMLL